MPQSFSASQSLRSQREDIREDNLAWLRALPQSRNLVIGDVQLHLIHDLNNYNGIKYVFDFEKYSESIDSDIDFVLFGNTHLPCVAHGKNQVFLNPGSLGFPIQVNPKPTYATLSTVARTPLLHDLIVDNSHLIDVLKESSYNKILITYLENGYVWPKKS